MTLQYKDIVYTLHRSHRKTASIYIERDGQVTMLVPEELDQKTIDEVLEKKRSWIYRNLAEWKDLNATRVQREYVNGEGFLYMGRTYRLKLVSEQRVPLLLKDGYFCLCSNFVTNGHADTAFKEFYKEKAKERIRKRVRYYAERMGLEVHQIKVLDLKHRWASCNTQGHLNFHWKCMMAPGTIIDYIVVHELAHLLHTNHTVSFWNEVDKVLPDFSDRKEWLRVNGAGMDV